MKKISSVIIVLLIAFYLTACANELPKIKVISEDDTLEFLDKVHATRAVKNDSDKYRTDLHAIVRTKLFKELLQSRGYDSIYAIEDGKGCFGVFNANDIKNIDNKHPTKSNDINH